jgi:tellurite resistance protein TerC
MESIGSPELCVAFGTVVVAMLAIDMFVVGGGKEHRVSFREAATWSVIWVMVSIGLSLRRERQQSERASDH